MRLRIEALKKSFKNSVFFLTSTLILLSFSNIAHFTLKLKHEEIRSTKSKKHINFEDVNNLYGDKILIKGLETCKDYRKDVLEKDRWLAPAGLFNTGTNLMTRLLQRNCLLKNFRINSTESLEKELEQDEISVCKKNYHCMNEESNWKKNFSNGTAYEPPWGKHSPVSWRSNHPFYNNEKKKLGSFDKFHVLPVVMIKDVVFWMNSMCRNSYGVMWKRSNICPYLVLDKESKKAVKVRIKNRDDPKHTYTYYNSLLDMWNVYYKDWFSITSFPRLIIRYEDLLYHPKEVIQRVCQCVGGEFNEQYFVIIEEAVKVTYNVPSNSLSEALLKYGSLESRRSILTDENLQFVKKNVNLDLLEAFHYLKP